MPEESASPEGGLVYLSLERVRRNPGQPRQHFSKEEIASLADSIRQSGLLQPIMVRRSVGEIGPLASYEIVAGERRWRAAREAGLSRIPALVRQLSDREALELGIIENVQRADLNPLEEAQAYDRLIREHGATQEQVAKTVGRDRSSIANALRLLKLDPAVLPQLIDGSITAGHGRALLMCKSPEAQRALANRIAAEGLNVREAERAASALDGAVAKPKEKRERGNKSQSPTTLALEDRFRRALGTKVALTMEKSGEGELRISFFSEDELHNLIEKIGA
jgi:ParB family chromosome partitioning protein